MKKNKLIISFALCVMGCAFIAGCGKREIKNADSAGRNIICFGDSITYGYGVERGEDYPAELEKLIGISVKNAGVDGDTTPEALQRLEQDVLSGDPYLVIVEFCGNDFLHKIPRDTTVNNICQIVRLIQAKGAMVAVVDISAGLFLKEYRSAFSKLAREEGAIFIPAVLNGVITNPSLKSDFLHPNRAGYKLVAERIYQEIFPHLRQKTTPKS